MTEPGQHDADESDDPGAQAGESDPGTEAQAHRPFGTPGSPLNHSSFHIGFFGGLGALTAYWLGGRVLEVGSVLILIVVAMFLAAGLNPAVEFFMRRQLRRSSAVLAVNSIFLAALTLFVMAFVPVIGDQVAAITKNAPGWLDDLQRNRFIERVDERFGILERVRNYITDGDWASGLFGGVVGFGFRVLSTLANAFIVVVLTLYFLASLPSTKSALYRLAPASRRDRVARLGDQILGNVGSYVSGAFIVAVCAGVTSVIFLFIVGLGEYAVALAFVVALLDIIPMIGATIGAVIVTAIGLATDPKIGLACLVFYLIYQQLENYVIYPRLMSRAVDIPGAMIVIAAVIGASLLGVVGALLAVPTAAALLLLTKEIFIRRQDAH